MSLDPHSDWWRGMSPREFWPTLDKLTTEAKEGDWISVPRGYSKMKRTPFDFSVPDLCDAGPKLSDRVAEALDTLYSQLEKQIVNSRLNLENLVIETWTECDETELRVCARFVPRSSFFNKET